MTQTETQPRLTTLIQERTQPADPEDHERLSHYVKKAKLTEAMVMGSPVIALCGKVWVPSRNPDRYPVCPDCKRIWEKLRPGSNDPDE